MVFGHLRGGQDGDGLHDASALVALKDVDGGGARTKGGSFAAFGGDDDVDPVAIVRPNDTCMTSQIVFPDTTGCG